jgi:FlaA1/EpsC-like NDP-sugar epimerase
VRRAVWAPRRLPAVPRSVAGLVARTRRPYLLTFDLVAIVLAAYVAVALRFDQISAAPALPAFPVVVALLVAIRTLTNVRLGLYSRRWGYASVPDLVRIVCAVLLGSILSALVFYSAAVLLNGSWAAGFPRSFWFIEALVAVAILGGVRFAIRAASDLPAAAGVATTDGLPTLLYGAGRTGVMLARSAQRNPGAGVRPVGFLDDDPSLREEVVGGLRVFGGVAALPDAVARTGARVLLITMPGAPGSIIRQVVDAALQLQLEVRTVPSLTHLLDGTMDAYRVRRVRVEDLLRRPMVSEHASGVDDIIRDRTVVITGAGGSIGSELARQVFALGPRRLVLVDRAESPLYLVQRELETRRLRGQGSGELRVHLANVASREAMRRLIADEAPSVIFHAAAYKHVPLMEEHPSDAVHVNMGGTMVMLDAAEAAGVERFVFVSTDKAVRPTSVMGASKRIAEMLVADAAQRTGRPYVSVRFGNVLGSTGSVVPIFQAQLENGEPLTITHPDMTRFFMTIPEAAWLILDAAALGRNGDLFVLDMGDPVKVMDLAHDLIRLAGRDPDSQPIETVGLRPGEKLHEELFYDAEHVERTESAKVLRANASASPPDVREDVFRMLALASGANERALGQAMFDYLRRINTAPADGSPEPANGFTDAPDDEADGRPSDGIASRGSARRRRPADEPTTVA